MNDQIWEISGHFFAQSLNLNLNFEWEFWLGCGVELPHEHMGGNCMFQIWDQNMHIY